jgi:predicted component of type VI protein secretion system
MVPGEAASYDTEETTGEGSGRLRNALKVTFRPTLQVPSALVGPRVIGRKLEECFDVVVPIGARVGLRVDVANAPHSLLGEEDDYLDDELGTRDQVHAHIIRLIERVRSQILLLC